MPFTSKEDRQALAWPTQFELKPGDKCFVYYRHMKREWAVSRRWTTADKLYAWVQRLELNPSWQRAKELAWQVFFALEVMPYELEKRAENGDVHGDEPLAAWVGFNRNVYNGGPEVAVEQLDFPLDEFPGESQGENA